MSSVTIYELDERKHPNIAKSFPDAKYFNWITGDKFDDLDSAINYYTRLQKYRKGKTFKIILEKRDGKKKTVYSRKDYIRGED